MTKSTGWLAAHIFYAPPWESLLRNALFPLVAQLQETDLVQSFFFIRYWEQGPHIRLRLKGVKVELESQIKPKIEAVIGQYLAQNPTTRNPALTFPPDSLPLLPNNSIQYLPYVPETDRYGGPHGLPLAEDLFEASSRAVMTVIGSAEAWDYDHALGTAIAMHLVFAHALGLKHQELIAFFEQVSIWWLPLAQIQSENKHPAHSTEQESQTLEAFAASFESQKEQLAPFCAVLLEGLEESCDLDHAWLNRWALDSAAFAEALAGADIQTPPDSGTAPRRLWPLFESCIHMTNNRLGVHNQDEAFLGYLIAKSLAVK